MQSAERGQYPVIAWVESPLRLVAAAEIIFRGARFAECVPFFNIPWRLLGSAAPADGRIPVDRYLRWVRTEAADAPLVHLAHQRETEAVLTRVRTTAGLQIRDSGLPVELILADAQEPLEGITPPTSARTTLTHVLAGTGSSIRARSVHRESAR